jgi:hypothetical protein
MSEAMPDQRFPYEKCHWSGNESEKQRWYEILESVAPRP